MNKKRKIAIIVSVVILLVVSLTLTLTSCALGGYKLTFDVDGAVVKTIDIPSVGTPELPDTPIKSGYTFEGWYFDKETLSDPCTAETIANKQFTADTVAYAKWIKNDYTITYNLDGGINGANPSGYAVDTATITLADPTKVGYTFGGWYGEGTFATKVTEIAAGSTENKTLFAKWTKNYYTITYNLDGGINGANPSGYAVDTATITLNAPTRVGYTFGGWYDNTEFKGTAITEIATGSTGDKTLFAKWTAVIYTIKYVTNCATVIADTTYDMLTMPNSFATLTRDGYVFEGWYDNADTERTVITAITKDNIGSKILVAKWTKDNYTIVYNLNEGINGNNPSGYAVDTATFTLADPTKVGYTFGGWFEDDKFATKVTEIAIGSTGNKTLFAKWTIINYDIKYTGVEGATNTNPITYNVASRNINIVAPTKVGYTFTGWGGTELGGAANMTFTILAKSTGIREYVAHWTKDSYTLTYMVNGGTDVLTSTVTYDIDSIPSLEQTTKTYYDFDGWYTTAAFENGTKILAINETNIGTMTLYARWTAVQYTITYETNLGTSVAPATYTIETLPTLAATKKDGNNFEGWYTTSNFAANTKIIEINTNNIGTMTLYAKWIQRTEGLSYQPMGNAYAVSCGSVTGGDVVIASEYKGLPVAVIADNAFYNTTTGRGIPITSIVIPDSVVDIGMNAFRDCSSLKNVDIPNSVIAIDANAFDSCINLVSVNIPNSVLSIGGALFHGCNINLKIYCECLEKNMPRGWDLNWYDRADLSQIKWGQLLSDDGLIYAQDGETGYAVVGCVNVSGDLVIPNTFKNKPVTKIAANAFYNTAAFQGAAITSVVIPDSVTEIGAKAFRECLVLRSANLPSSLTVMGEGIFSGCESLMSVNIENGVTSIAAQTFSGCSVLNSVNIPKSVTKIGDDAFSGCGSLANVIIPSGVKSIGLFAFKNCTNLLNIFIPISVTDMGGSVFYGCTNLTISCERASSPLPLTWDVHWMGDVAKILWEQTRL